MILRISLFFIFLFSATAFADIIFFDLNNAPQEIAAAERGARARGERVHVLPHASRADQVLRTQIDQRLITAERRMQSATTEEQRSAARREFDAAHRDRDQLLRGAHSFGANRAREALAELRAKGVKISSMIISGHSGNHGSFSGDNGALHRDELRAIMKDMPELAAGVTSLVLPGCNTSRPACLEQDWLDGFPNLRAVIGYNGTAPAHTRGAGHQLIERFLREEARLAAAKTPAQVRAVVSGIIPADVATTASICLPGKKYATRSGVIDMTEAWKQCDGIAETLQKHASTVSCYVRAEPGCENPPSETQSGPLREYYVALQRMRPCHDLDSFQGANHLVTNGESLIRLMYWKHITKNFANRGALNETRDLMLAAGVPRELADKLLKVKDMSRREWMDYESQLQEHMNGAGRREFDLNDEDRASAQAALPEVIASLGTHLTQLDGQCVPFHWVEANSGAQSACSHQLGKKAWEAGRQQLPVARLDREIEVVTDQMHEVRNAHAGDQDPIVSDAAAVTTIRRGQAELFRARLSELQARRSVASVEADIARLGDDPRNTDEIRQQREYLVRLRGQVQAAQDRVRQLGPPLDADSLRADPARFFTAAARAVDLDDSSSERIIREHNLSIDRLRQRMQNSNQNFRQRAEREIQHRLQKIQNLEKAKADRQEHREYLQQMARIFTTPGGDPAAQNRVAQIVANRVRIVREARTNELAEEIRFTREELESCTSSQAAWCSSHLTEWREKIAQMTQELQTLQSDNVLNYY